VFAYALLYTALSGSSGREVVTETAVENIASSSATRDQGPLTSSFITTFRS